MNKSTFYMRFYSQPREKVEEYAREFKELFPLVINYRIATLAVSMNMVVPKDSFEVTLEFNTAHERDRVRQSEESRRWYTSRAYPGAGAKFHDRKHGDPAFKVG
jgi:hypothetical protein